MRKEIILIIFGVFMGATFSGLLFLINSKPRGHPLELQDIETPSAIVVDISGCVKSPGIYHLPYNSRVIDAINAASGLTIEADTNRINLSKKIYDENKIIVPSKYDYVSHDIYNENNNTQQTNKNINELDSLLININSATREELEKLPGIGSTKADNIVQYRKNNGLFDKIEDVQKVPGIGSTIFSEIYNLITVSDY